MSRKLVRVIVETAWGDIDHNARYSHDTGFCYFLCPSGLWLNYEPQSVKKYTKVAP